MPSPAQPRRLPPALAPALWAAALAFILIHAGFKPHSNTLYPVFKAGGARWLASRNLYPKVDEYIYSPFAAAFFTPFALLPDPLAGILWRILLAAAYLCPFAAWLRSPSLQGPSQSRRAAAWLLLLPLSAGDLFNGQANPLVIGLLMAAVLACRSRRWFPAAFCVAIAAYFKVYPLALGLLLAVIHPRHFPLRLAAALAALFGLSLILQHPPYVLAQYSNWIGSLRLDPRRTLHYFGTYRDFWLFLRVLHVPISLTGWAILQAASGAALAFHLWRLRRIPPADLDLLLLALATCWMLLFGPATESATYVILAPPLLLAALRWSHHPAFLRATAAAFILLIASQMLSSWAHQHQNPYTHLIQPAAALIFAIALLSLRQPQPGLAPAPPIR